MIKCDWCGMEYPDEGYTYWYLWLYGTELHIICDDCKKHLKKTGKQPVQFATIEKDLKV